MRTRANLILYDASASREFSADPYVQRRRSRSVLCFPIIKQANLVGALYLENNLTPGAFTPGRIMVLEFLAAQAAISLENAWLYSDLQRSEAFLAEGQKISGTGSWSWNVGSGELIWSQQHYRILGCDPGEEPSPTFQRLLQLIHPEDRLPFLQKMDEVLVHPAQFETNFRIIRADGDIRYLQGIGRPIVDASGETRDYMGTTIDVTERRRGEDALRDAQAELSHAARVTTMGELAASIAHEVNQPLASIVTNAEACLGWLDREQPNLERARNAAARIVRDGQDAGEVIRSIRAMLRKTPPEGKLVDINKIIEEALSLMHGELRRHDVALETDLYGGFRHVVGDRVRLQQVIVNLVKNGIDALSEVTQRRRLLRVGSSIDADGNVLIAVEDCGSGLDQAKMSRVFEPFFTTKREGMGMGLSICRSIVEAHGGRLWASRRSPHGSIFRFTVPARKCEDETQISA